MGCRELPCGNLDNHGYEHGDVVTCHGYDDIAHHGYSRKSRLARGGEVVKGLIARRKAPAGTCEASGGGKTHYRRQQNGSDRPTVVASEISVYRSWAQLQLQLDAQGRGRVTAADHFNVREKSNAILSFANPAFGESPVEGLKSELG